MECKIKCTMKCVKCGDRFMHLEDCFRKTNYMSMMDQLILNLQGLKKILENFQNCDYISEQFPNLGYIYIYIHTHT